MEHQDSSDKVTCVFEGAARSSQQGPRGHWCLQMCWWQWASCAQRCMEELRFLIGIVGSSLVGRLDGGTWWLRVCDAFVVMVCMSCLVAVLSKQSNKWAILKPDIITRKRGAAVELASKPGIDSVHTYSLIYMYYVQRLSVFQILNATYWIYTTEKRID